MWLYGKEAPKVGHHPAKFSGYRQFSSGDVMVSICHVIFQGHVTKGSSNFVGHDKSPSYQVW